ncbi:nucleotide sugar dehydrogenase [Nocardia sp. NPDC058379]|uniref:nucleotide sugar dehydrogenase n=1 Tax=unclassified Nocardia TaxID=2637762 RepID=UPI00365BEA0F
MSHRGLHVVVLGCGFVGLPVCLLAVAAGHVVTAYDTNSERIARLLACNSYIVDVTDDDLVGVTATGRFLPTSSAEMIAGFDVALIAVPTPLASGRPDLSFVEDAARLLSQHVRPGSTVILESSTYPGTTEDVVAPILSQSGLVAGVDFHLGYAPERINPGMGLEALSKVPKIVAGVNATSASEVRDFWSGLVPEVVAASNVRTAELAKLIENAFRLVNVSFVNELAQHARALGASIGEALDLAATKPYGFMRFQPGVGAGGHCLPVDTRYLAWQIAQTSHVKARLLDQALRINELMPQYVTDRVIAGLERRGIDIAEAHILVVGMTYKADVADLRNSCALTIIEELRARAAEVTVVDPYCAQTSLDVHPRLSPELVEAATVVVVLVAHTHLDLVPLVAARYVFDACGTGGLRADDLETL